MDNMIVNSYFWTKKKVTVLLEDSVNYINETTAIHSEIFTYIEKIAVLLTYLLLIPLFHYIYSIDTNELDIAYIIAVLIGLLSSAYLLRLYVRGSQLKHYVHGDGCHVIVTGANSGVGYATAKIFALQGYTVHMLCRNIDRAQAARYKMIKEGVSEDCLVIHLADLADLKSVKKFCDDYIEEYNQLNVLVLNAGMMAQRVFTTTVDGNELTYQSNYLAHHLMIELLLPLLSVSATTERSSRIVSVASIAHEYATDARRKTMNDTKFHTGLGMSNYNRSKLAQVLSTKALARELTNKNINVIVSSCHPGNVFTNILSNGFMNFLMYTWLRPIIWFILKTETDGAQNVVFCVFDPSVVSGNYYHEMNYSASKVHDHFFDDNECQSVLDETREALKDFLPTVEEKKQEGNELEALVDGVEVLVELPDDKLM